MNRGEIWLVHLDPTIGAEIRKTRPVVVVNSNGCVSNELSRNVPQVELSQFDRLSKPAGRLFQLK
ncbi:MAG: type II toxin-antitoxin system PemK/MazF family toxin [Chloroflexota bacterium]